MPVPPSRPLPLEGRAFRGSTAVDRGWLTRNQLRSSAWRRLRQDVHADARLPVTHGLHVAGVGLVLPPGAGFARRSAALLWGVPGLAGADDPVEVVVPPGTRWNAGDGVRVRALRSGQALAVRRGRPCTGRVDTAVDLVRDGDPDECVVLLDHLVRAGLADLPAVRAAVAGLPRCRGSAQARAVAALADGLAESPQETRLRLLLARAGLPPPVAQYVVRDAQGFVARVDLAYPELRLAIEYDGLWHGGRAAFLADRRRANRMTAAGWVTLSVTTEDMRHAERLVARVLALRARQAAAVAR
ncbi:endonuclease domain-containing protein [Geodermatophilus sp. FMUSA9-8]|uniref:endonuclease domain-containing protein n=1 Tax=Geodermatophilus sp. FMUSA9-8 TaxID=3120155 RepID=UPI003009E6D1